MKLKTIVTGSEMDRMPGWAFRFMSWMFGIQDLISNPDRKLDRFEIREGDTVVDWGCGTGRYLKRASGLAGESGTVYAVDIHELAVASAHEVIRKHNLKNVKPLLTDGKKAEIPAGSADVIYALDMFHMVKDTGAFLTELNRIMRPGGVLYLEDGHQPRNTTLEKISRSGWWEVTAQEKTFVICRPRKTKNEG